MFGSLWKFGADASEFKTVVRQMPSEVDKANAKIAQSSKAAASAMSGAFKEIGNLLVGGAVVSGLNGIIEKFGRIDDLAIRFGTNAESIQRVGYAAQLAGTDIEAVANAMTKAGIAATTAAREGGKAGETFDRAGISAKDFAGADLARKVEMVAEAYATAGGNADKTAAIIEIMGARAGANLIPLISNLDELKERMGGVAVVSDEMTKRLAEAGDQMDLWKNQLTVAAADGLNMFTDSMERLGSTIGQLDTTKLQQLYVASLALVGGNVMPLWNQLQTGKTIEELDALNGTLNETQAAISEVGDTAETLTNVADVWAKMGEQAQAYEDAATKAHKAAEAAAKAETEALQKQIDLMKQRHTSFQQDLAMSEAMATGNTQMVADLQRQADEKSAMAQGASPQEARRYAENQATIRAQGGGGGGGGASGGVGRISVSDPMNALRSLASDSMMRADDGSLMVNRKAADAASQLANLQERFNREAEIIQGGGFAQNTAGLRARRALELETKYQNKAMEVLRDVDPVLARDMLKSAGFTEAERAVAQEQAATGTPAAKADPAAATSDKLDKVIKLMTERLPIRVLAA
jgi:hypothetical protein